VQARDIVKSRGTNLHRYQYLRVGGVFDLGMQSFGCKLCEDISKPFTKHVVEMSWNNHKKDLTYQSGNQKA
jgi:hypothetical protein